MSDSIINEFLIKHKLPEEYKKNIHDWFSPVAEKIVSKKKQSERPLIIGVNGAQGSGKSTLSDLLETLFIEEYELNAVTLSIDDFYYTRQERLDLSESIHPLLATRGVPGTHDVPLALDCLHGLLRGDVVRVPRFEKASDDRYPEEQWSLISEPVDIIILEGWCVGAEAQTNEQLLGPINNLEAEHDADLIWREYVNQQLQNSYAGLFGLIDCWIMLKAPSFEVVYNWRLEQEHKLRASQAAVQNTMDDEAIAWFIKFYQRITEHVLNTLPNKVDFLFELDNQRKITKLTQQ
mgnify:CR=1 FL=1